MKYYVLKQIELDSQQLFHEGLVILPDSAMPVTIETTEFYKAKGSEAVKATKRILWYLVEIDISSNKPLETVACTCVCLLKICKDCKKTFFWLAASPGCRIHGKTALECPRCQGKNIADAEFTMKSEMQ